MKSINNEFFMNVDIPEAYKMDVKSFIERPFYVDIVPWRDQDSRYTFLQSGVNFLPGDIIRSNESLSNVLKTAAYGRSDLVLNISTAGTIAHQGTILIAIVPPLPVFPTQPSPLLINTMLSGPHAFLNANEATSVTLPVPWFCNTDLQTLDMGTGTPQGLDITTTNGNYATLLIMVLNPLRPSSGSSLNLSIVIEACFKHLDLFVPTPRFVTWLPQTGDINNFVSSPVKKKKKITKNVQYLAALGSLISLSAALIRIGFNALTGIDVPIDEVKFVGQSGLASNFKGVASGLMDAVTKGAKSLVADGIDDARSWLRSWTGLHNPNQPGIDNRMITTPLNFANIVDAPQYFQKLDPNITHNRIVKEPLFGTDIDEMQIAHVIKKDQFLGTIVVKTTDTVGTLLWCRPISPFQGGRTLTTEGIACSNNLELMHSLHRGWSGDLTIKLQSVMNNKQQVKLKVLKLYNPSMAARTGFPAYQTVANAPSHLLEFTQGGQVHNVLLPFLSRNNIQPRTELPEAEGLIHGMYYIYVAQPLVVAEGSPEEVEINIYMTAEDNFAFYGYTTANIFRQDFNLTTRPVLRDHVIANSAIELSSKYQYIPSSTRTDQYFMKYLRHNSIITSQEIDRVDSENMKKLRYISEQAGVSLDYLYNPDNFSMVGNKVKRLIVPRDCKWKGQVGDALTVMNQPQFQSYNAAGQVDQSSIKCNTRLLPNVDIRPLIRRLYKTTTYTTSVPSGETNKLLIPLSSFVGENPANINFTPIDLLSKMFYGKTVGFKFRLLLTPNQFNFKADGLNARVYYLPQGVGIDANSNTITATSTNLLSFANPNTTSVIGEVPLTYIVSPAESSNGQIILEFSVPDTSFYKFMGSPNKFLDATSAPSLLSTADFGSLVFQITNTSAEKCNFTYELFVGLTDESRLGFHCIAPPFSINKTHAFYLGSSTNPNATVPIIPNPFIYKGGYLV